MANQVIIDKPIIGWGRSNAELIRRRYSEIKEVGTDIPQREDDGPIAIYAKQHGCDILTADIKAYSEYLRSGIKRVQIEEFAYNEASEAYIYLVKILD